MSQETLPSRSELEALIDRTQQGDQAARQELCEALKQPGIADRFGGDHHRLTQRLLIKKIHPKDRVARKCLTGEVRRTRRDITGPDTTPLERLLIEVVLTSSLYLTYVKITSLKQKARSPKLDKFYDSRIAAAQRSHLTAIKTLAQVRKMAVPALRTQQTNPV